MQPDRGETNGPDADRVMKNPDAIAVIVSALRHVHGDDIARMMLGLIWHLKYIYGDQPGSLHVVDLEIATPDGTLASKDVWLRLAS